MEARAICMGTDLSVRAVRGYIIIVMMFGRARAAQ